MERFLIEDWDPGDTLVFLGVRVALNLDLYGFPLTPGQLGVLASQPEKEQHMHYKNGRPAQNGDKVMVFPAYGAPYVGILHSATAGNDYCNGMVAPILPQTGVNLQECLRLDDVQAKVGDLAAVPIVA